MSRKMRNQANRPELDVPVPLDHFGVGQSAEASQAQYGIFESSRNELPRFIGNGEANATHFPTAFTDFARAMVVRIHLFLKEFRSDEHRRKNGSDTWHWCKNCSNYPTSDYDERATKPGSGEQCNECQGKDNSGNCSK